jgi:hypothetical protein
VPLAPQSPTACRHCGVMVDLPPEHVALLARTITGREQLAAADALWRSMPMPMPAWFPRAFVVLTVAGVSGLTVAWAIWGLRALGGPGRSFLLLVMYPVMAALYTGLEMLAYWSPFARLETAHSALRDPGFPELLLCRTCGAALSVEPAAIVTRCAYCRTDNLLRRPRPLAYEKAKAIAARGRADLDEAIANLRALRLQRSIVRWVGVGSIVGVLGLLTIKLWSQ